MIFVLGLALWLVLVGAGPAHAGPVVGIFAAIGGAIKGSFILSFLARIVVSAALSRLAMALAPKPRQPGIRTEGAAGGSQNPAGFILGHYATDGVAVCPPMSHGNNNNFLTLVIELGDIPRQQLLRVLVNDEWVTFGTTPSAEGYGLPVLGKFAGYVWVKYYDGTQTTADPMLLSKYGSYPERPWSADMVGAGICYAIVTVQFKRDLFNAIPRLRFELSGIPLYDPRKDSTVGGVGAHRFDNPLTWESSRNPVVQVYNIHRGIQLPGGNVWGFRNSAGDLPLDSVFAAANACDALVNAIGGGTEPAFRSDYEIYVSDEPMSICEEIFKACMGQAVEVGGQWKFRVGAPGLPVRTINDPDDLVVTQGQTFAPFKGLAQTFNAVHAAHPLPDALYQAVDAPPLYNFAWEVEDGDRRLVADLQLPTVTGSGQVQRLMSAYIREERRQRRHSATLPPDLAVLEPFDVLSMNSETHGYSAKLFEVDQAAQDLRTGQIQVSLIERDPSDYTPPTVLLPPAPPSTAIVVQAVAVVGFAVAPFTLADSSGLARRNGIRMTWDGAAMAEANGLSFEIRVAATGQIAAQGFVERVAGGEHIVGGLLAATVYQVRARPASDRTTVWTAWLNVTTPDELLRAEDIGDGQINLNFGTDWVVLTPAVTLTPAAPAASLPASAVMGTFPLMRGGASVFGIDVTLSGGSSMRAVRMRIGSGKSAQLDQVQWLVPGVSMRLVATAAVPDRPAGGGSIVIAPELQAIGLATGESIQIVEYKAQINYWRR